MRIPELEPGIANFIITGQEEDEVTVCKVAPLGILSPGAAEDANKLFCTKTKLEFQRRSTASRGKGRKGAASQQAPKAVFTQDTIHHRVWSNFSLFLLELEAMLGVLKRRQDGEADALQGSASASLLKNLIFHMVEFEAWDVIAFLVSRCIAAGIDVDLGGAIPSMEDAVSGCRLKGFVLGAIGERAETSLPRQSRAPQTPCGSESQAGAISLHPGDSRELEQNDAPKCNGSPMFFREGVDDYSTASSGDQICCTDTPFSSVLEQEENKCGSGPAAGNGKNPAVVGSGPCADLDPASLPCTGRRPPASNTQRLQPAEVRFEDGPQQHSSTETGTPRMARGFVHRLSRALSGGRSGLLRESTAPSMRSTDEGDDDPSITTGTETVQALPTPSADSGLARYGQLTQREGSSRLLRSVSSILLRMVGLKPLHHWDSAMDQQEGKQECQKLGSVHGGARPPLNTGGR